MPKISVVVPVYNVEKYIAECLESLVNQTFKDIEIIIVDDGSPDNSAKIYKEYAALDSRVKVIEKKNAGVSEARNTGIDNAIGDFLMFVDSDDWMELNGCEILYNEYLRSGADMIVADAYSITNGNKRTNRIFKEDFVTEERNFIQQYQAACIGYGYNPAPAVRSNVSGLGSPWNKLYSRKIIVENNLRYDSYVKGIYDDNLFTLYYLDKVKKISYIAKPVYNYRILEQSLTQSYKSNTLDISRRIFERISGFIAQQDDKKKFEKPFYLYVIRRLSAELSAYYFSKNSDKSFRESLKELKKMIHTDPYWSAIKNVESSKLMAPHLLTYWPARLNWPLGIWLTFRVRRMVKSLLKR
ncbi:glycosyltransferase family 2 protein [Desulfosporosinus youngiae]|uniref:Glycosyl transferase n=1 Tax=Desulfosporosinus youngiae DSM 17734 TaxID=768710 RepID=H5XZF6_9FIRM|nr:glycosyltransferase family 2 protein [Desulfosporosinus youngiae]EHQ91862.1 glycosyl transferase [Desulfosporosinus youngiae DSM 17734]